MPRLANRLMIAAMALTLAACKIVPTTEVEAARQVSASGAGPVFDPDKAVDAIWAAKVLPYLKAKAGDFVVVHDLAAKNADEAGQKYGYRAKEGTVPWTYVVKAEGRIVAANTGSRAATIDVDVDGDGKADMVVQIGPAVRGTALRDSLDFVSFNAFTNQIEYAQFGKAFNARVNADVLQALPREKLVGRSVTVLGAYVLEPGGKPPLVTPAELSLGAGS